MGFAFFTENTIINLYNLGLQNGQTFEVVCVGGGGGGGGPSGKSSNNCTNGFGFGAGIKGKNSCSGGGGGEVKFDTFIMNNYFNEIPIVVGKTGSSYLKDNTGANGESSSFGSLISSNGGYGGGDNMNSLARINNHPKGLTSSGGIPLLVDSLTDITQSFAYSYVGGAGGGGYMPGCKLFGGTPGTYFSNASGKDGSGLSGFMINSDNTNLYSYLSEQRNNVRKMPSVWAGKSTLQTGIVCIYW